VNHKIFLYGYLLVISNFVPEGPGRQVAGLGGIFIVIGGIFVQDIVFMYMTHPYPYVRALLEPSGQNIRMFIKENGIKSVRVSKTLWSTTLELKYPATLKFYGKCKEIIINHEYPWSKRIPSFKPGLASYCLTAGTLVSGGMQSIESLKEGDYVMASSGQEQKVLKTFSREYNGKLVEIDLRGLPPIALTEEHPVLTTTFRKIHRLRKLRDRPDLYEWVQGSVNWKEARDIKKGDYVVCPRLKKTESSSLYYRLLKDGHFSHRNLPVDREVAFVLGLYTAEGSLSIYKGQYQVTFTFGSHEKRLISELVLLLRSKFNLNANTFTKGSATKVYFSNKDLVYWLKSNIGCHARQKRVPKIITFANKDIIEGFLDGLAKGDGCKIKNESYVAIATASKRLAYGCYELLLKIGWYGHIIYNKREGQKIVINGVPTVQHDRWNVHINQKKMVKKASLRYSKDFAYLLVKNIKHYEDKIPVYNIKTEDETYTVPFIVHNCGYVIKHPQTTFMILYEYPQGSFDVDHANPRPVFRLEHAPGDYFLAPIPLSVALKTANPTKELPIILRLSTTLDHARAALAEALRGKKEWHSRCVRAEEALEGTDVETKALLEERTDRVAGAIRYMLALREDQLTIENALKHYKKFSLTFSKWLALTVCFLGGLGFLYGGRDSLGGAGEFLGDPTNMIFALLVTLAVCVVLYYGLVKKGGKS